MTALTTVQAQKITAKAAQSLETIEQTRRGFMALAQTAGTSSEQFANQTNELAKAEGTATVWVRLQHAVEYFSHREDESLTMEKVQEIVINALTESNDTYSGRTNDSRRAFQDGVRSVASSVLYL